MKIKISQGACKHLSEISYYNNNYYRLPFEVNACDVVYEHYDGGEDFCGYSLGTVDDDKFTPLYWLHTYPEDCPEGSFDSVVVIDSDEIKFENHWT